MFVLPFRPWFRPTSPFAPPKYILPVSNAHMFQLSLERLPRPAALCGVSTSLVLIPTVRLGGLASRHSERALLRAVVSIDRAAARRCLHD